MVIAASGHLHRDPSLPELRPFSLLLLSWSPPTLLVAISFPHLHIVSGILVTASTLSIGILVCVSGLSLFPSPFHLYITMANNHIMDIEALSSVWLSSARNPKCRLHAQSCESGIFFSRVPTRASHRTRLCWSEKTRDFLATVPVTPVVCRGGCESEMFNVTLVEQGSFLAAAAAASALCHRGRLL